MDARTGMGVVEESGEEVGLEGELLTGGKGCEGGVHRLRESDEEEKGVGGRGWRKRRGVRGRDWRKRRGVRGRDWRKRRGVRREGV